MKKKATLSRGNSTKFLPCVVRCIEGTHVKIQEPSDNEAAFVKRKVYQSINVMAICDHSDTKDEQSIKK